MTKGRMGEHDVLHDYEIESWGGGATQKTKRDIGGRAIRGTVAKPKFAHSKFITCRFVAWAEKSDALMAVDGPRQDAPHG